MASVLIETMTKRQLLVFSAVMFVMLLTFFILGGTKASSPANATLHIATLCKGAAKRETWYSRYDKTCPPENQVKDTLSIKASPKELVFTVLMPHSHLVLARVNQFVLVSMNVELEVVRDSEDLAVSEECKFTFSAKLGYSSSNQGPWTLLAESKETRPLRCVFSSSKYYNSSSVEGFYRCEDMHFFELGSAHHPHYLVNIRVDERNPCIQGGKRLNSLNFVEIHQNGLYTLAWFISKTVLTPVVLGACIFFWRRVSVQGRAAVLMERALLSLGISLLILLVPIEWLTLGLDLPFMTLLSDIRQGQFYAVLLSFWCIFAGEHTLDQEQRGKIKNYRVQMGCVITGCVCLLIFDLIERGVQLRNPFHTIWKGDVGENVAKGFIVVAAISAVVFALFFLVMIVRVFRQISLKRQALPVMAESRRIYYEGMIYRFRVLIGLTLLSAILTVVCFILDHVNEAQWKFIEDNPLNDMIKLSSALHFGTFGLWNVYVVSILVLYSPVLPPKSTLPVSYRRRRSAQEDSQLGEALNSNSSDDPDSSQLVYSVTDGGKRPHLPANRVQSEKGGCSTKTKPVRCEVL